MAAQRSSQGHGPFPRLSVRSNWPRSSLIFGARARANRTADATNLEALTTRDLVSGLRGRPNRVEQAVQTDSRVERRSVVLATPNCSRKLVVELADVEGIAFGELWRQVAEAIGDLHIGEFVAFSSDLQAGFLA